LPHDTVCRIYYVHRGERLGYKLRRVPRGTRVFALRDGTPVLIQICGNPVMVTRSLPFFRPSSKLPIPAFSPFETLESNYSNVLPRPFAEANAVPSPYGFIEVPGTRATPVSAVAPGPTPAQVVRNFATAAETPETPGFGFVPWLLPFTGATHTGGSSSGGGSNGGGGGGSNNGPPGGGSG